MYYDFIKKILANNFSYSNTSLSNLENILLNYTNVFIRVIGNDIILYPISFEKYNINGELENVKTKYSTIKVNELESNEYIFFNNENEKYPLYLIKKLSNIIDKYFNAIDFQSNLYKTPFLLSSNLSNKENEKIINALSNNEIIIKNTNIDSDFSVEPIKLDFKENNLIEKIKDIKNEIKEVLGFDYEINKKERLITDEVTSVNDYTDTVYSIYKNVRLRFIDFLSKNNIEVKLID